MIFLQFKPGPVVHNQHQHWKSERCTSKCTPTRHGCMCIGVDRMVQIVGKRAHGEKTLCDLSRFFFLLLARKVFQRLACKSTSLKNCDEDTRAQATARSNEDEKELGTTENWKTSSLACVQALLALVTGSTNFEALTLPVLARSVAGRPNGPFFPRCKIAWRLQWFPNLK